MRASMMKRIGGTVAALALASGGVAASASPAAAAPNYCGSAIHGGVGGYATGGCSGGQGYFQVTVTCSGGGSKSSQWVYRPANAGRVETRSPGCTSWLWAYPTGSYISVKD